MKYIRRRLLLVLVLVVSLVACGGADGRKQKYLEQANTSFAAGDYDKARINFKNVLQIDPKDIQGRVGYAKTLEKLQDWRGAVGQYRGIIEEDPQNAFAKVKLGQLYLLAKEKDLALTLAEEVLASDGTNDSALALKAGALVQSGDIEQALKLAEQAYKLNKDSIDNIVLLVSIYSLQQRVDDSIALLEHEQTLHPESNSIQTLLAQLYLRTEHFALAEEALKKLVSFNPGSNAHKVKLANFYQVRGREGEAEQLLKNSIAEDPTDIERLQALHILYFQRKEFDKAEAVLKDALKESPDNHDLSFRLAGFYLSQKNSEQAKALYTALLEQDQVTALKARNRLAYLATQEGNIDEAMRLIGMVLAENPADVDALTMRGGIYLAQNKPIDAINDLRTVVGAKPDSPDILKLLGRAHQLNKEYQQAIDLYKSALNLKPRDVELRVQLADLLAETGDSSQAIKQLIIVEELLPDNISILEKLVRVQVAARAFDAAERSVERWRKLDSENENPRTAYYLGLVYQGREQHQQALAYFDEALRLKPGSIEPMTSKIKSYIALKQLDQAIAWLGNVSKDAKDSPVALNLQGELWMAKKDWKKSRHYFDQCITLKKEWWIPYRNIALLERSQGSDKHALDYLLTVVDQVDGDPLRIETANYAERAGEYGQAIQQYEAILAHNKDNTIIMNNLAMLIVSHMTDSASLQRAAELATTLQAESDPSFLDTAGWVQFALGDYQRALPIFQQALRGAPEDPSIQYHLAMTYLNTSDKDSAARYLEKALQSETLFPGREDAQKALDTLKQQS